MPEKEPPTIVIVGTYADTPLSKSQFLTLKDVV